jgi:hypothetical protein
MEKQPKISREALGALLVENRKRYCTMPPVIIPFEALAIWLSAFPVKDKELTDKPPASPIQKPDLL